MSCITKFKHPANIRRRSLFSFLSSNQDEDKAFADCKTLSNKNDEQCINKINECCYKKYNKIDCFDKSYAYCIGMEDTNPGGGGNLNSANCCRFDPTAESFERCLHVGSCSLDSKECTENRYKCYANDLSCAKCELDNPVDGQPVDPDDNPPWSPDDRQDFITNFTEELKDNPLMESISPSGLIKVATCVEKNTETNYKYTYKQFKEIIQKETNLQENFLTLIRACIKSNNTNNSDPQPQPPPPPPPSHKGLSTGEIIGIIIGSLILLILLFYLIMSHMNKNKNKN